METNTHKQEHPPQRDALSQMQQERDLYRRLLELGTQTELDPFLEESLALIVGVTGAKKGYLALYSDLVDEKKNEAPLWWKASGYSPEEITTLQKGISHGIILETMRTQETVNTPSAQNDPRFAKNLSVKGKLEAVLCVPVGGDAHLGVLYLQDREQEGPFSKEDKQLAEDFARHLAPSLYRLVSRKGEIDPTEIYRAKLNLDGLIGRSQVMARVFQQIRKFSDEKVSVLLTGPSGTGKTALARALHNNSSRANKPFIDVNCANLNTGITADSELFGHKGGIFANAPKDRNGKIATAEGGTLFLDEIGELPQDTQTKLFTFLDSGEYYPAGSDQKKKADVRIIAATNHNLLEQSNQGKFRKELYFRLKQGAIDMPGLAARLEDIPLLVKYFFEKTCQEKQADLKERKKKEPDPSKREELDKKLKSWSTLCLDSSVIRAAEVAEWSGQVRELGAAIYDAMLEALDEGVQSVERRHLFPTNTTSSRPQTPQPLSLEEAVRQYKRQFVLETLQSHDWNIAQVAKSLKVARGTVYSLINELEIKNHK